MLFAAAVLILSFTFVDAQQSPEGQIHALLKARVGVYSEISPEAISQSHLEPVADIAARVAAEIARVGADARIAVLPEGPMTIPYLADANR